MSIFKNKKLSIIICACAAVFIALLCWFITLKVQESRFEARFNELQTQLQKGEFDIQKYTTDLEYRESIDYVIKWAEENLNSPDEVSWIKEQLDDE